MPECKDCSVEVCDNNMSHPQKPATGSLRERNTKIIHDRAECTCEICEQMHWRNCEYKKCDYRCNQLISKITEHDGLYNPHSEMINDNKLWFVRVAGIKVPETVLNRYVSVILDRMDELGMGSVGIKDELTTCGRLETQRADCHRSVLMSVGFDGFIRSAESNILSAVLDNYIEREAKRRFHERDFDNWVRERMHKES